jgi:hypothetical protein
MYEEGHHSQPSCTGTCQAGYSCNQLRGFNLSFANKWLENLYEEGHHMAWITPARTELSTQLPSWLYSIDRWEAAEGTKFFSGELKSSTMLPDSTKVFRVYCKSTDG